MSSRFMVAHLRFSLAYHEVRPLPNCPTELSTQVHCSFTKQIRQVRLQDVCYACISTPYETAQSSVSGRLICCHSLPMGPRRVFPFSSPLPSVPCPQLAVVVWASRCWPRLSQSLADGAEKMLHIQRVVFACPGRVICG
jgi:hypothetical protein